MRKITTQGPGEHRGHAAMHPESLFHEQASDVKNAPLWAAPKGVALPRNTGATQSPRKSTSVHWVHSSPHAANGHNKRVYIWEEFGIAAVRVPSPGNIRRKSSAIYTR